MLDPILIMLIGMAIVVGGIIQFKLHPVLSLLLAAIVVALLTPTASVEQFFIAKGGLEADALKQAHKHRREDCFRIWQYLCKNRYFDSYGGYHW